MTFRALCAFLRRVCLLAGILVGITCLLLARPVLYRVGKADFAESQAREKGWSSHKNDTLDEYITYKTQDRLVAVSGPAWADVYSHLDATGGDTFYVPSDPPFNELQGQFDNRFTYLALEQAGQTGYLDLATSGPRDYPAAPTSLRYPWRQYSLYVFLVGLLAYFIIPWPKPKPDIAAYGRVRGAFVPDLLIGSLFIAGFYALPWLIITETTGATHPFVTEGGWMILTSILFAFALFGVVIYGIDMWYEAKSLRVAGDEAVIESFKGVYRVPLTEIQEIACTDSKPPKGLVKLGLLLSLFNWRAAGPTLLMAGRHDSVLELILKNGQKHRFVLTCLKNWEPVVKTLKQAGIPVAKEFDTNQ